MSEPEQQSALFRGITQKLDGVFTFWPNEECPMYTADDLRKIANELDSRNKSLEQLNEIFTNVRIPEED